MFKNWFVRSALIVCLLCSSAFTCSLADLLQQTAASAPVTDNAQSDLTAQIQAVLDAELQALKTEDLAGYMATIHPDSASYSATETVMRDAFAAYDLESEVTLGEAVLLDNGDASIPFVLTTRKVSGGAFRDNEITGNFILRLDGTQWKIYSQEMQNIRYLS